MTDFAMIKDAVTRSVESTTFTEDVVAKRVSGLSRLAAGFVVRPLDARPAVVAELIQTKTWRLDQYRKNCGELDVKLAANGVTPLCFVPSRAWDAMCKHYDLYQLTYHRQSKSACANISSLEVATLSPRWPVVLGGAASFAALFTAMDYAFVPTTNWLTYHWGWNNGWAAIALGVVGMLSWIISINIGGSKFSNWYIKSRLARFTDKQLLDTLFKCHANYQNGYADVTLPQPPADVSDTLWKMGEWDFVKVACVSEAIQLDIVGLHKRVIAYRDALRSDPIVYVQYENAVAIVAQWGDFPMEEKVVDECLNTAWCYPRV